MIEERYASKSVYLKGKIYVFGGNDINGQWIKAIEMYSFSTKTWSKIADVFDDREDFCVCAFMNIVFVIGGRSYDNLGPATDTCLAFNTKDYKWKKVARMNQQRRLAACAVFEGRIVVSGGLDNNLNESIKVESYDVVDDKWSLMPIMTSSKAMHSLVVVKNKLFVIGFGSDNCEVFDNCSKKFVEIKPPQTRWMRLNKAISIGSKIYAILGSRSSIICYDVNKEEWLEASCVVPNCFEEFSCVKIPWF